MSAVTSPFQSTRPSGWRGGLRGGWHALTRRAARHRTALVLGPALSGFLVLALWPSVVVTVPAGHVAVRWWRFLGGTEVERTYGEGAHLNLPWDDMPVYDVRLQQTGRDFDVLTADGMTMTVDVAVRYRLDASTVGLLHREVGPAYRETLLLPAIGTYARQVFSGFAAEDAYAAQRLPIQERIRAAVVADLTPRGTPGRPPSAPWILVDDVLIRSMRFPPLVERAIDRKMEQYQVQKEYIYRLERERLESERKRVEAEGIAKFQEIVGAGISPNYLKWKGIDATLALAQSANAKVVVIGTPKDGLPLILGGGEPAVPVQPGPSPSVQAEPGSAPGRATQSGSESGK